MSRMQLLKRLILQYKYQLVFTYILFTLEMTGLLLRPFFLAMAVNDLLKGSYEGLILLACVHVAWLVIGTIRQMYDTRTYSAIYTTLVTRFLSRRFDHGEISRLSAHSNLAREFVNFLETDMVYILEAVYNLFGSLILLFYLDASVAWICLAVLVPVMLVSKRYGKKMQHLYQRKNDELEKQVDIIGSGNNISIKRHYTNLRKWQIRISDQEAKNFGVMELMVMVVIVLSLLVTTRNGNTAMLPGHLIAIYAYIQTFVAGLDTIPYAVERFSSLKDITRRIELETDDLSAPENTPATAKAA
jgi:ABC-type multidrug transport system fused ATPase/permease subunit